MEFVMVDGQMRVDFFMGIIGFMILVIHRVTLLFMFPQRFKLPITILFLAVALFLTSRYRQLTAGVIYWNGLSTFFNLFLLCWLLKGPFFQKVFAFYFLYVFTIVQFYLTAQIASLFLSPDTDRYRIIVFIIMVTMYIIYVVFIYKHGRRIFQKLFAEGRKGEWALYAFGAVFSYVFLTIARNFPNTSLLNIYQMIFTVWSFYVLCYAIISTHEKKIKNQEAEFAKGIITAGRDHYQKMNEQFNNIRIMKHDYKFHLNTALDMLGAGDIEKSREYLKGLQEQFAGKELPSYCDNQVINSLVSDYSRRCKDYHIDFEVSISVPGDFSVPNYELCIVLGNLLENAVEACQKITSGRKIELAVKMQGGNLAIMVHNSFDGNIAMAGEKIVSTKKGGGLGLQSVKAVTDQYCQSFFTKYDAQWFTAYVLWGANEQRTVNSEQ